MNTPAGLAAGRRGVISGKPARMGPALAGQVDRVMAQPQRGQVVALPRQVVPQEEQVLAAQVAPVLLTQVGVQPVLQPLLQLGLQPQPRLAAATVLSGQADWGNRGRLKNSSHTFSANSSQGGTEQKP